MFHDNTPRWTYNVNSCAPWMASFVQNFNSPDIYMWSEEEDGHPSSFAWASPHLDDVCTGQVLVDRAASLRAIFDGAMFIVYGLKYHPFELSCPHANNAADQAFVQGLPYDTDVSVEPFSPEQIQKKAAGDRNPLSHSVGCIIFLARYDDVTRALLKYVGVNRLTYFSLYALRDWMKHAGWADVQIAQAANWSNSQLSDFTNTANNPAYLGPFARHGGVARPPRRPMKLEDAEGPMRKAARAFLRERAETVQLQAKWDAIKI